METVGPMLSISTSNDEGNGTFHFGMKILVGIGRLVGYHLDGSLQPTSFESYEVFQARRLAKR